MRLVGQRTEQDAKEDVGRKTYHLVGHGCDRRRPKVERLEQKSFHSFLTTYNRTTPKIVRSRRQTRTPKRPIPSIAAKNAFRRRQKRAAAAAAAAANDAPAPDASPSPVTPIEIDRPLSPSIASSDELALVLFNRGGNIENASRPTPAATAEGKAQKQSRYSKEQRLIKELTSKNKYLIKKCRNLHKTIARVESEYKRLKKENQLRRARFMTFAEQINDAMADMLNQREGQQKGCYHTLLALIPTLGRLNIETIGSRARDCQQQPETQLFRALDVQRARWPPGGAVSRAEYLLLISSPPRQAVAISRHIRDKPDVITDRFMHTTARTEVLSRLISEKAIEEPETAALLAGVGIRKPDASARFLQWQTSSDHHDTTGPDASVRFLQWQTSNDHNDTTGYIDWIRKHFTSRIDEPKIQRSVHHNSFLRLASVLGWRGARSRSLSSMLR
ncbi:hypothetical protein QBC40DRAFT_296698 [Triangularia verruculosa]|uniref:Uncharacterized protein n=1 Tax=Triangularia verruculosa TaxID=2587418 RepID=A0AAN6XHL1_9PEZI|nr:hypothetical protein QBC40DRAFT_296698 [Triangularia verruculosa]